MNLQSVSSDYNLLAPKAWKRFLDIEPSSTSTITRVFSWMPPLPFPVIESILACISPQHPSVTKHWMKKFSHRKVNITFLPLSQNGQFRSEGSQKLRQPDKSQAEQVNMLTHELSSTPCHEEKPRHLWLVQPSKELLLPARYAKWKSKINEHNRIPPMSLCPTRFWTTIVVCGKKWPLLPHLHHPWSVWAHFPEDTGEHIHPKDSNIGGTQHPWPPEFDLRVQSFESPTSDEPFSSHQYLKGWPATTPLSEHWFPNKWPED